MGAGDAYVGVEVSDGVSEDLFVLLGPFGGADETFFFGVPAAEDDGATGLPTLLEETADAVNGFEHGGGAAVGVDGAVDPGVAVVAGDDPVFGVVGAGDGADDVPDGADGDVLLEVHVDGDFAVGGVGGAGAEVVGEGKGTLPVARGFGSAEGFEDGGGVAVGEGVGGDGRLIILQLVGGDAAGVGQIEGGGDAGGHGVAGVDGKELDGAALDGGSGTVGAFGIDVAAEVAVVGGVGVDEDAFGSVLLGDVDLDAAEVGAVADDDDLVFDADAHFGKPLEVGEGAVVGVDDLGGDVAGGGGAVEGGKDFGVVLEWVAAVFVGVDALAGGAGHKFGAGGVEGFDDDLDGLVEENVVGNDLGLEAGGFELFGDVLGGLVVFGGAGPVGLGGEGLEMFAG